LSINTNFFNEHDFDFSAVPASTKHKPSGFSNGYVDKNITTPKPSKSSNLIDFNNFAISKGKEDKDSLEFNKSVSTTEVGSHNYQGKSFDFNNKFNNSQNKEIPKRLPSDNNVSIENGSKGKINFNL